MKVLKTLWTTNGLNPAGTIGIIKAKNTAGDIHIYIGSVNGNDKNEDIKRILDWGTKYKAETFKEFLK